MYPANRLPRRVWGIRTATVAEVAPDYFASRSHCHPSLRSRLYDRFQPFVQIAAAILIAATVTAAVAAIVLMAATLNSPRTCTFDGGGTIAVGAAATVTTGQTYVCTEDGTLVKVPS